MPHLLDLLPLIVNRPFRITGDVCQIDCSLYSFKNCFYPSQLKEEKRETKECRQKVQFSIWIP